MKWTVKQHEDTQYDTLGEIENIDYPVATNGSIAFRSINDDKPELEKLCAILNEHWIDEGA